MNQAFPFSFWINNFVFLLILGETQIISNYGLVVLAYE